ncbi:MAG: DNA translocase FtsK [Acidobacteria bacterium]|nr:DNA translocase FtsK [Acidobacteriota bacterium]
MSVYPRSKVHELTGVLLLSTSLLLAMSLITYNALDPSLNVSSPEEHYSNYGGKVGAWISDLLFQLFGLPAVLTPIPLFFAGYKALRSRALEYPFLKLTALFCGLLALSAILTLLSPSLPFPANYTPGGVLGIFISDVLLKYLNKPGSLLILATMLVFSMLVSTRFSIEAVVNWAGKQRFNVFQILLGSYRDWQTKRVARKEVRRLRNEKKTIVAQQVPRNLSAMVEDRNHQELNDPEEPAENPIRLAEPVDGLPRVVAARSVETTSHSHRLFSPPTETAPHISRPFQLPSIEYLRPAQEKTGINEQELMDLAEKLSAKCAEFDVRGRVLQIHPGPVVTTFEFKPDPGIKYNRITNLADDLCLGLKAESIRIDRMPGKNTVGIEVPNTDRQPIYLREIIASPAFQESPSKLTLALGKLINGHTYVTELDHMPHLLAAGATGSGKSVALNCMVCSILYKATPVDVRFIMIDPKRLELGVYEGIPHLLTPIVTDPKEAANALNWAVAEMETRYRILARRGVRNIEQYNEALLQRPLEEIEDEEESGPLPYIVIIVDELSDLMMTAGKEVEWALTRLAQMARAIGIHLILATQRPSVDVITGLIKANFPARISFRVSSKVDSRTILDSNGAEQLLGQGDMLILPPGTSRLVRVHGAYISEAEIKKVTDFLKKQAEPEYQTEIMTGWEEGEPESGHAADPDDPLYLEAARFVTETGKASTSLLQRRLRIGYGRAARLLDLMEQNGIIGPPDGSRAREVLVPPDYFSRIDK